MVDSMRTKGSNMKLGSVMEERAQIKGSGLFLLSSLCVFILWNSKLALSGDESLCVI